MEIILKQLLNYKRVRNDGPIISGCLSKISIRDSTCKTWKFLDLFSIYSTLSKQQKRKLQIDRLI